MKKNQLEWPLFQWFVVTGERQNHVKSNDTKMRNYFFVILNCFSVSVPLSCLYINIFSTRDLSIVFVTCNYNTMRTNKTYSIIYTRNVLYVRISNNDKNRQLNNKKKKNTAYKVLLFLIYYNFFILYVLKKNYSKII